MGIQLFHSDLPAGQDQVYVFDERWIEFLNRRNTGVILLGDGREGIAAFHGIENSRFTLCFHQSVDFGLHGRIVISGSSEAVFAVGTVSPFAVQHFLGELVHGLSRSDRIRSDGAGIVLRYAIATDVLSINLQRASADRIALISFVMVLPETSSTIPT